jgi:hypothetical protein
MDITPVDLNVLKEDLPAPKKKRGRPKKSAADPVQSIDDEEKEKKELREKLMQYADHNEDIVMRPVNDKVAKLVNEMSLDELRARCRQGKKICSGRMDNVVGNQVIELCNMSVGQILDCLEELQESTRNDELLHEVTTEYLSLHLLDMVPEEIKILGIYSSHVLTAYRNAQMKKPKDPKGRLQELKEKIQQAVSAQQQELSDVDENTLNVAI